jgi:hypothetical protein
MRFCMIVPFILFEFFSFGYSSILHCEDLIMGPHTHIAIYGSTDLMKKYQKEIGTQYSIIITEWWKYKEADEIKRLNPNIKILIYRDLIGMRTDYDDWNEAQKHPEWFLTEEISKQRILHDTYKWYLMDCTNEGYQKHITEYFASKLELYPVFDGLFLDDVLNELKLMRLHIIDDKKQHPNFSQQLLLAYHNNIKRLLENIKTRVGNKVVIINTNTNDYNEKVDGVMFEGFVHGSWQSIGYSGTILDWVNDIHRLTDLTYTGKYVLVHSGVNEKYENSYDVFLFAYTSYLLCCGPKTTFSFISGSASDTLPNFGESRINLGQPQGPMQKSVAKLTAYSKSSLEDAYVYTRSFEYGMVLVNPNSYPVIFDLPSDFIDRQNQNIKQLILKAHTGKIILRNFVFKSDTQFTSSFNH